MKKSKPTAWANINLKDTDICLTLQCSCGANGHIDGHCVFHVQCPVCGMVYRLGDAIQIFPVGHKNEDEVDESVKVLGDITIDGAPWSGNEDE